LQALKKKIEIKRTAHYYLQVPKEEVRHLLFVIHGYGQLAAEFINSFKVLKESSTLVIAPEAISKFYDMNRKPVANWMTSHERLDEMKDYIRYLNQLSEKIAAEYPDASISMLGFSQGVSTAFRWLSKSKLKISNFYAYAGSVPPELSGSNFLKHAGTHFYYIYGKTDRILPPEMAKKHIHTLRNMILDVNAVESKKGHQIDQQLIKELMIYPN
jgi:predicted esterase